MQHALYSRYLLRFHGLVDRISWTVMATFTKLAFTSEFRVPRGLPQVATVPPRIRLHVAYTKRSLHFIGLANSPLCCSYHEVEGIEHALCRCDRYGPQRPERKTRLRLPHSESWLQPLYLDLGYVPFLLGLPPSRSLLNSFTGDRLVQRAFMIYLATLCARDTLFSFFKLKCNFFNLSSVEFYHPSLFHLPLSTSSSR